jgi:hypothetical protein
LTTVPGGADDCITMHRSLPVLALSVLALIFASLAFASAAFAYNGASAAAYADAYWQTYNPA